MKAERRFNLPARAKLPRLINELTIGYGLRPVRVLASMFVVLAIGTALLARHQPWREALLMSSGAMFTFGASADRLRSLPAQDFVIYLSIAFAGVTLTALFVTAWAKRIFADT